MKSISWRQFTKSKSELLWTRVDSIGGAAIFCLFTLGPPTPLAYLYLSVGWFIYKNVSGYDIVNAFSLFKRARV